MENHNPFSLEGKTILITGGAGGIGTAVAKACADLGATIVLTDIREDALADALASLPSLHSNAQHIAITADLTNGEQLIVNEARWTDGQIVRNRLDDISYDPMGCQEDLIMRIARENAKTVFGCEHGFDKIDSISDFRMQVPVSVYDDYPKYIERIANGERNVLTAYLTEHLSTYEGYKKLPQSRWGVQAFYDYN